MAQLIYEAGVPALPSWAEAQLSSFLDEAGVAVAYVSSTYRAVEEQAQAMYNNLVAGNDVDYGSAGRQVQAVGQAMINDGWPAATVQAAMVAKINELGPGHISKHMDSSLTVADVRPSRMPSDVQPRFVEVMNAKHRAGLVGEWLYPAFLGAPKGRRDPAFHIEFVEGSAGLQAAENVAEDVAAEYVPNVLADIPGWGWAAIGLTAAAVWWLWD